MTDARRARRLDILRVDARDVIARGWRPWLRARLCFHVFCTGASLKRPKKFRQFHFVTEFTRETASCASLPLCPRRHAMPPKRGRAAAEAEDETAQLRRHKSATEEAFAELVCPITFSLPVDPVMAEDGKVYERSAIEEWLKQQGKSPVTNLAMGTKLLPALQVKNMIRTMVASGALTGDKVDAWKLKLKEEEEVAEMLRFAEAGDGAAMCNLGSWYKLGQKGLALSLIHI